ncbi:MAG TPA: aldo/keto reductase [Allosphingosinicella sp.]|nr:aldo/keto reductase [Allosphingosinicella sp.]
MSKQKFEIGRRSFLAAGGALAVAPLLGEAGAVAAPSHSSGRPATSAGGSGRRKLGSLEVSAIGMGVQNMRRTFHGTIPSRPEMIRIIQGAHERGITFFDTAEVYGPHECEQILGEAARSFRNDIVIATKFGFNVDLETGKMGPGLISRPEHIKRAVEGSLRRLRTDRVDLLYQHRVDPTVPIEDVAGAVAELRREGKVLHWGLSEMGLGTLRRAHAELPVAAVQNEYSMLWRGPEQSVLPTCRKLGIGFVPFAPLGYGFLTGAIDSETTFAPKDYRAGTPRMSPENLPHNMALVALVRSWAERKAATPGQVALAWLMAQASWIVPIPGTTQMPHMLENAGAVAVRFTAAELEELNRAVRAITIRGARMSDTVQAWSDVEAPPRRS